VRFIVNQLQTSNTAMTSNQEIKIAPNLSRTIALILDFFLLTTCVMILGFQGWVDFDYSFLASIAWGLLYFGIGNSSTFNGQTLGKKAFGIKVVSAKPNSLGQEINISEGLLRYMLSFGILILLSEVPKIFFREYSVVAFPIYLEFNMFLGMLIFFFSVACVLIKKDRRALHDLLLGTVVISCPKNIPTEEMASALKSEIIPPSKEEFKKENGLCFLVSFLMASLFWFLSINHSPSFSNVAKYQYVIENDYPVRFLNIQETKEVISMSLALISTDQTPKKLSEQIGQLLLEKNTVDSPEIEHFYFEFFNTTNRAEASKLYSFNLKTKETKEIENNLLKPKDEK
jgi:uncharacterized RDD family membrane protein YckC